MDSDKTLKRHMRAPHLVALALIALIACVVSAFTPAWCCPCADIAKPSDKDKDDSIMAGLKFSHTPEYDKEFAAAIAGARKACEKHKGEARVAIVSDIDETLLDNRSWYQSDPNFNWAAFTTWVRSAGAPTLKPTADLLAWARDNGYAIFLITGRKESDRLGTIENLVHRHVAYDGLFMRPDGNDQKAEEIKTQFRANIERMGFKIIVSIGDQYSDLYGGHAEDCEKLPNKMYYIP